MVKARRKPIEISHSIKECYWWNIWSLIASRLRTSCYLLPYTITKHHHIFLTSMGYCQSWQPMCETQQKAALKTTAAWSNAWHNLIYFKTELFYRAQDDLWRGRNVLAKPDCCFKYKDSLSLFLLKFKSMGTKFELSKQQPPCEDLLVKHLLWNLHKKWKEIYCTSLKLKIWV